MTTHEILINWCDDRTDAKGVVPIILEPRYPLKSYALRTLDYTHPFLREREAHRAAWSAREELAFADACDLQPSYGAWMRVINEQAQPTGFDHTILWKDRNEKRYVLTTEPYASQLDVAVQSCRQRGWSHHVFPAGVGLWNPSDKGGTRLVLVSLGAAWGLRLEPIVAAASAALRPWSRDAWPAENDV